jgi:hypothetical protein
MIASRFWRTPGFGLLLGMVAILAYLHFAVFDRRNESDDLIFSLVLDHGSLWSFMRERYLTWTGRWPMEIVGSTLVPNMWAWRVLNIAVVFAFCVNVARLGFGERGRAPAAIAGVFALFWLLPPTLLQDAAWWVTGSFYYLWPVTFGLYAMRSLFERRERSVFEWALVVLAGSYAAYNEQIGLVLLGVGIPRWIQLWREGRYTRGDAVLGAALVVNSVINAIAPGARLRYAREIANWYADYGTVGLLDKVNIGLGSIGTTLARADNLVATAAVLLAIVLVWTSPAARRVRVPVVAGLGFLLLAALAPMALSPGDGLLQRVSVSMVTAANVSTTRVATLALAVFGATCLVVGTFIALRDRAPRAAGWLAWTLMLGFASLAALAFSPTVYASGERTRFALCAVLMIVLCRLIAEARERFGDAWLRFAAIPLAAVVVLRVLQTA